MKYQTGLVTLVMLLCAIAIVNLGCNKKIVKTSNLNADEEINIDSILVNKSWFAKGFIEELPDTLVLIDSLYKIQSDFTFQAEYSANGALNIWIIFQLNYIPDPIYSKWNQVNNKIRFTFPTEVIEGSDKFKDMWYTYYIDDYSKVQVILIDSMLYHDR